MLWQSRGGATGEKGQLGALSLLPSCKQASGIKGVVERGALLTRAVVAWGEKKEGEKGGGGNARSDTVWHLRPCDVLN